MVATVLGSHLLAQLLGRSCVRAFMEAKIMSHMQAWKERDWESSEVLFTFVKAQPIIVSKFLRVLISHGQIKQGIHHVRRPRRRRRSISHRLPILSSN